MEVKVEVLGYNITDEPGKWIPDSIIIDNIQVKVSFGDRGIIEIEGLRGYYAPEFTPNPFLVDGESIVKLTDAAEKQGIDLFGAGVFWYDVDEAIAKVLEQTKVTIA